MESKNGGQSCTGSPTKRETCNNHGCPGMYICMNSSQGQSCTGSLIKEDKCNDLDWLCIIVMAVISIGATGT